MDVIPLPYHRPDVYVTTPLSVMQWLSGIWTWYVSNSSNVNPVIGALGAAVLIAAAIQQARIATRQADVPSQRHHAQTAADLRRRIAETFSKAVEQIASDKLEVRLGGLYTLQRLSRESSDDYLPIMELVSAFVRTKRPLGGHTVI